MYALASATLADLNILGQSRSLASTLKNLIIEIIQTERKHNMCMHVHHSAKFKPCLRSLQYGTSLGSTCIFTSNLLVR